MEGSIMRKARNIFWIVFALSVLLIICARALLRTSAGIEEPENPRRRHNNLGATHYSDHFINWWSSNNDRYIQEG